MKSRTRAIVIALTVVFLLLVFLVPLSKAQVARISKSALLLQKTVFSLPARLLSSVAPGSSEKLEAKVQERGLARPLDDKPVDVGNGLPVDVGNGVLLGHSVKNDTSPALRDIPPLEAKSQPEHEANVNPQMPTGHKDEPDAVVQGTLGAVGMPPPILDFDGIPFPGVICNCAPPDTDGAVGLTQYVAEVNEGIQVFNKSNGASVLGPVAIGTLWSGFGGVCEFNGAGDGIVLYDRIANRWLVSQFGGTATSPTSASPSRRRATRPAVTTATISFWAPTSSTIPRSACGPTPITGRQRVHQQQLLRPAGFRVRPQRDARRQSRHFRHTRNNKRQHRSPLSALRPRRLDAATGGRSQLVRELPNNGIYKIYHFHADFVTPASVDLQPLCVASCRRLHAAMPGTRNCVPQSGQVSGNFLDGIGDRLMHRAAYRNFGDHEALVTTTRSAPGASRACGGSSCAA